jgi:2-dehydro-3-deoxyglucarate aldolase/4-hydroxy-2-oxoheptanedioate aldolase
MRAGETVFGTMIAESFSPGICRVVKLAGYDFIIIDTEHSLAGVETVAWMIRAGRDIGLAVIVRAPAFEGQWLNRYLDLGAAGILIPRVEDAEQCRAIVNTIKYPPVGIRGLATVAGHSDYDPPPTPELVAWANENLLLAVQIETQKGLDNRQDILSVPGVDALFIGPNDLSLSMGYPGGLDHPAVLAAMDDIVATAKACGVAPGMHVFDIPGAKKWLAAGAKFLAYSSDLALILSGSRQALAELRG